MYNPAVYWNSEEAQRERDATDYSIRITHEMATNGTAPRKVRIYADGIYDLFHYGHARQFMQAKNMFPKSDVYLIVGISKDEDTHRLKGKTVTTEHERVEAIRHCRYVDEVYPGSPYYATPEFLAEIKADFIAHDSLPYNSPIGYDHYQIFRDLGMFVETKRTEDVSTTDMISRIVKHYDDYARRNLLRGYTRHELNVGYVQEKRYALAEQVTRAKEVSYDFFARWEAASKQYITRFLTLFQDTPAIASSGSGDTTTTDQSKLRDISNESSDEY